ncbi:unnamed protein product [Arctia plantaginis]|uniref:Uncharacterized protein n=1 Tax=Arctia plantaginis TaxID=874455 RepID=A0A8S1BG07_ARCPL|nr:unnamed protein product [Arctia plantaginis]
MQIVQKIRKSKSGYVFIRNGGTVTWNIQKCVVLSRTEAEYFAACAATQVLEWIIAGKGECRQAVNAARHGSSEPVSSKENLTEQAQKMLKSSGKKIPPMPIGTTVRIPDPEVDRGDMQEDASNLLAVVLQKQTTNFTKLEQSKVR